MYRSLSIIIPNYNGEELFKIFMPSVLEAANNYPGKWEIIIVDDQSTDNSREVLEELQINHPIIKVIYNEVNLGFAGTCNVGMNASTNEVLFFLNSDVKLNPDYFHHFNSYFENPKTFAVTTKAYKFSDSSFLDGLKTVSWNRGMPKVYKNIDTNNYPSIQPPYYSFAVQGAYFFADAHKMKQLQGFDELLSPYIFEETDLSYRALKRGWKIYYEPLCISFHAVGATIKKKKKRKTQIIATKNKLLFVWKNIHSKKLLLSHFIFLGLRILLLNRIYFQAFSLALRNLQEIKQKRLQEKNESVIRDEDLFKEYNF